MDDGELLLVVVIEVVAVIVEFLIVNVLVKSL